MTDGNIAGEGEIDLDAEYIDVLVELYSQPYITDMEAFCFGDQDAMENFIESESQAQYPALHFGELNEGDNTVSTPINVTFQKEDGESFEFKAQGQNSPLTRDFVYYFCGFSEEDSEGDEVREVYMRIAAELSVKLRVTSTDSQAIEAFVRDAKNAFYFVSLGESERVEAVNVFFNGKSVLEYLTEYCGSCGQNCPPEVESCQACGELRPTQS